MTDQLMIERGKVVVVTEEGRRVERPEAHLVDMLRAELLPPLQGRALPDGVKFCEWRPPFLLVVHQQAPHVRQVRWIDPTSEEPFGPGTKYRKVRLSVPYAVTFATFVEHGGGLYLGESNELYFRNEPLRSRDDTVGYPALLNVSRIATATRERSWICTQYLNTEDAPDWTAQLHALLEHVWNGGFNLSSEHHEGASWYGASTGVHADLHPVENWEKASAANDAFGLTVPWKPAPLTVGLLMEAILEEHQANRKGQAAPPAAAKPAPPSLIGRFLNFVLKG